VLDSTSDRPPKAEPGFRPDIQGLRAVAVGLVVVYHLYPSVVRGGYVGVDVFFVISGFLITGHLARGLDRTGRIRLLDFYGRRARRLLPAAAVVLTVTWLLSRWLLPVTQLPATAQQIRASALYFENWVLAHDAVNYLDAENAATPVQHFWSLSVEEQFYLIWPLLFLIAGAVGVLVARRARRARTVRSSGHRAASPTSDAVRRILLLLGVAVVVASFVYSVLDTSSDPQAAYFVTTTRMWELGVGGVLALLPAAATRRLARVGVLAWLGLAAIVVSALMMSGGSAFPGWIALFPVLGAALVLVCGSGAAKLGPARVTASAAFVFVGDISYSLYLWHWPLIVFWLAYQGGTIGVLDGPAIAVASIVLAWLTKVFVEDRVRQAKVVTRHTSVSLATALAVVVPAVLVTVFLSNQPTAVRAKVDAAHPGAAALLSDPPTPTPAGGGPSPTGKPGQPNTPAPNTPAPNTPAPSSSSSETVPPLAGVPHDIPLTSHNGCEVATYSAQLKHCSFGDTKDPVLTVALVGDSHAGQWSSVLDSIGKRQHWKFVAEVHAACRWTSTMTVLFGKPMTACHDWGVAVLNDLITNIKPDVVITSERPSTGTVDHPQSDAQSWKEIGQGMAQYADSLAAHGIASVAIQETPEPNINVPDCLAARTGSITSCSAPAATALLNNTPIDAAAHADPQLAVIDMNDLICDPTTCAPVVGGLVVYRDEDHLTESYTLSLLPYLQDRLLATGLFPSAQR
jgi:peptidoglycan/LPS O-acetylase OafA/YrhL